MAYADTMKMAQTVASGVGQGRQQEHKRQLAEQERAYNDMMAQRRMMEYLAYKQQRAAEKAYRDQNSFGNKLKGLATTGIGAGIGYFASGGNPMGAMMGANIGAGVGSTLRTGDPNSMMGPLSNAMMAYGMNQQSPMGKMPTASSGKTSIGGSSMSGSISNFRNQTPGLVPSYGGLNPNEMTPTEYFDYVKSNSGY